MQHLKCRILIVVKKYLPTNIIEFFTFVAFIVIVLSIVFSCLVSLESWITPTYSWSLEIIPNYLLLLLITPNTHEYPWIFLFRTSIYTWRVLTYLSLTYSCIPASTSCSPTTARSWRPLFPSSTPGWTRNLWNFIFKHTLALNILFELVFWMVLE